MADGDCGACHKPARRTAVRIPLMPGAPIEVERTCETYGCINRLHPFLDEAMDPEGALREAFSVRGELGPEPHGERSNEDLEAEMHAETEAWTPEMRQHLISPFALTGEVRLAAVLDLRHGAGTRDGNGNTVQVLDTPDDPLGIWDGHLFMQRATGDTPDHVHGFRQPPPVPSRPPGVCMHGKLIEDCPKEVCAHGVHDTQDCGACEELCSAIDVTAPPPSPPAPPSAPLPLDPAPAAARAKPGPPPAVRVVACSCTDINDEHPRADCPDCAGTGLVPA